MNQNQRIKIKNKLNSLMKQIKSWWNEIKLISNEEIKKIV